MIGPRNEIPHQYYRVVSSKTSNTDIYKLQGWQDVKAIHLQVDNIVALTYFKKMWGTTKSATVDLTKEI